MNDDFGIASKTALVTGSGRNIGRAIVLELAARGANAARRQDKDFFETTDEDWHYYLNQQLDASWYLAKAFVPACATAAGAG
jgi:NAD(P)-dependent dehydrogenase (short-subunit alcohol dehydrogenase family)